MAKGKQKLSSHEIAFLMQEASRLFRHRFDRRAIGTRMARVQWRVMDRLQHIEGAHQVTLANQLDMEPITLSRHIDRMEMAGLVERRRDPADRRAFRIHMGPNAGPLLSDVRAASSELLAKSMNGLTLKEVAVLSEALKRIRSNLNAEPST